MKIVIRNLLLTIAIFINIRELKSSSKSSGSSPNPPKPFVGTQYEHFLNREIQVPLKMIDGEIKPFGCFIVGQHHGIPDLNYRKSNNYLTRAFYSDDIKLVLYVKDNGRGGELLGAKLPPKPIEFFLPGDPRLLNPDLSKSFITYEGVDYQVKLHPRSSDIEDIQLMGGNKIRPEDTRRHDVTIDHGHYFGLHFLIYKRNNIIVGAGLAADAVIKFEGTQ